MYGIDINSGNNNDDIIEKYYHYNPDNNDFKRKQIKTTEELITELDKAIEKDDLVRFKEIINHVDQADNILDVGYNYNIYFNALKHNSKKILKFLQPAIKPFSSNASTNTYNNYGGKRYKTKRYKTKRNKTKRNKTKRNKTKRNKTKRYKTKRYKK